MSKPWAGYSGEEWRRIETYARAQLGLSESTWLHSRSKATRYMVYLWFDSLSATVKATYKRRELDAAVTLR
jgi:hypothetical protein